MKCCAPLAAKEGAMATLILQHNCCYSPAWLAAVPD